MALRYVGTARRLDAPACTGVAGPHPDDRTRKLGGIVADSVVLVDHVRDDEPGSMGVAPLRGHDIAAPVGRTHGIWPRVGHHHVEHLNVDDEQDKAALDTHANAQAAGHTH